MTGRMQSRTQSDTQSIAAAHMMLRFAFMMRPGNVVETHEHKGEFKEGERYRMKQKAGMQ